MLPIFWGQKWTAWEATANRVVYFPMNFHCPRSAKKVKQVEYGGSFQRFSYILNMFCGKAKNLIQNQ